MKEKYKNRRMYFLTLKSKVISKPTGKLFKMGEKVGRKREKKEKKYRYSGQKNGNGKQKDVILGSLSIKLFLGQQKSLIHKLYIYYY